MGALEGAATGTAYAIAECAFTHVFPWLVQPSHLYEEPNRAFTALLLLLYPVLGAWLGAGIALLLRAGASTAPEPRFRLWTELATALSLVALFAANYLYHQRPPSLLVLSGLPVAVVLVLVRAASASARGTLAALGAVGNRWAVAFVLLGVPWVTKDLRFVQGSRALQLAGLCAVVLASAAMSLAVGRRPAPAIPTPGAMRRRATGLAAGLVAALAATAAFGWRPLTSEPGPTDPSGTTLPNVILISLDTVRADHLSVYGYPHAITPRLDGLAAESTRYTMGIASSDMTLASHASMFTGMYAAEHGAHYDPEFPAGRPLADDVPTLAELLAGRGYRTLGVSSNFVFIGYGHGLTRGFHYYDARPPSHFLSPRRTFHLARSVRDLVSALVPAHVGEQRYRSAGEINREVLGLLESPDDRPFFLFVNYCDAHYPYLPPPPFDSLVPGKDETFPVDAYYPLRKQVNRLDTELTAGQRRHLLSQYAGGIAYADHALGELLDALEARGLYETSLIVVTSDHGEAFGERGLLEHGVSVYQDQVFVPLLVRFPGPPRPEVVDAPASHVDLLPTILAATGAEIPSHVAGRDLRSTTSGDGRPVVAESYPSGALRDWHPRFRRVERAIWNGQLKLVVSTEGKRELYHLATDPDERHDLSPTDHPAGAALEEALEQWSRRSRVEPAEPETPATLDPETLDRLRSLGYTQ